MRWTVSKAATEWGLDRRTLASRLKAIGLDPKQKKTFHTRQISRAITGDLETEKIRETRERANLLEIERAELEKKLIPVEVAGAIYSEALIPIRQALDALPSKLCARCNPEDPALARTAIKEEVERILEPLRHKIDGRLRGLDKKPAKPKITNGSEPDL